MSQKVRITLEYPSHWVFYNGPFIPGEKIRGGTVIDVAYDQICPGAEVEEESGEEES